MQKQEQDFHRLLHVVFNCHVPRINLVESSQNAPPEFLVLSYIDDKCVVFQMKLTL